MSKKKTTAQKMRATNAEKSRARAESVISELNGMNLLGEIITWNARGRDDKEHTHQAVVDALREAELDEEVAREILPRHAFSRASKALEGERVIDVVRDGADVMTFQFTKRFLVESRGDAEWKYAPETKLHLNKTTGKITCEVKELEALAQKELDRCIEVRTTSDISRMVQQLFEKHADLFPVRDQGGVYFVPRQHMDFTTKIDYFLKQLGGSVRRFPIPEGTQLGDEAVQESIQDALTRMVEDHEIAINSFSLTTRKDTLEAAAEKIKATRIKIQAYANYLADQRDALLTAVDAANVKLTETVERLAKEKESAPEKKRELFLGNPVTAVIRWMGKNGWSYDEAAAVLAKKNVAVAINTIRIQLREGAIGEKDPAKLTKAQQAELNSARKELESETVSA